MFSTVYAGSPLLKKTRQTFPNWVLLVWKSMRWTSGDAGSNHTNHQYGTTLRPMILNLWAVPFVEEKERNLHDIFFYEKDIPCPVFENLKTSNGWFYNYLDWWNHSFLPVGFLRKRFMSGREGLWQLINSTWSEVIETIKR